jgi:hypothetical protein
MGKRKGTSGRDYEVGYGRPPVETRYPKGTSGNRAGRPRQKKVPDEPIPDGLSARHAALLQVLSEEVSVWSDGRVVRAPAEVALLLAQRERALSGDLRALRYLDELRAAALTEVAARERQSEPSSWRAVIAIARAIREAPGTDIEALMQAIIDNAAVCAASALADQGEAGCAGAAAAAVAESAPELADEPGEELDEGFRLITAARPDCEGEDGTAPGEDCSAPPPPPAPVPASVRGGPLIQANEPLSGCDYGLGGTGRIKPLRGIFA